MLLDIANWLASQACGTVATDLFAGELPSQSGEYVAVYALSGSEALEAFDGVQQERPAVRVLTRGESYVAGRRRSERCWRAFLTLQPFVVAGRTYGAANLFCSPYHYDDDKAGRAVFAFDVELWRSPL